MNLTGLKLLNLIKKSQFNVVKIKKYKWELSIINLYYYLLAITSQIYSLKLLEIYIINMVFQRFYYLYSTLKFFPCNWSYFIEEFKSHRIHLNCEYAFFILIDEIMQNFFFYCYNDIFIKYQFCLLNNKTLIIQLTSYTMWGQWNMKQIDIKRGFQ
jgi:hypothetical protein